MSLADDRIGVDERENLTVVGVERYGNFAVFANDWGQGEVDAGIDELYLVLSGLRVEDGDRILFADVEGGFFVVEG